MEKENTTIQIEKKVRKRLGRIKDNLDCNDYNEVIETMLKMIRKLNLWKELQEVKNG